jgi:hypothetical protein
MKAPQSEGSHHGVDEQGKCDDSGPGKEGDESGKQCVAKNVVDESCEKSCERSEDRSHTEAKNVGRSREEKHEVGEESHSDEL